MSFLENPFIIQCFNESSLPRSPAGRYAAITERVQAGMLSGQEGRRLMHYRIWSRTRSWTTLRGKDLPDLDIVSDGDYMPPDGFMDLMLADQLTVQYINLYLAANLEEEKAELLRKFFRQVQALKGMAAPPQAPGQPTPQANPEPRPTSPLVPNGPAAQQQAA